MSSKHDSTKIKRPSSPYLKKSPRNYQFDKVKVDRPSSVRSSREMWLHSLQQGSDMRNSPVKAFAPVQTFSRKRSGSCGESTKPGTPRYKSQEDMYDEILELKKTITSQKSEFDIMKSKFRRLEEENSRKDKCIDQLIDQITTLTESDKKHAKHKPIDNKLITTTMKQRQMKLEFVIQEKDAELKATQDRIKSLRSRARKAKSAYVQEVAQLQDALNDHKGTEYAEEVFEKPIDKRTASSFRQTIVKLSGENSQLIEENRSLKKDLEKAIDQNNQSLNNEEIEKAKRDEEKRLKSIIRRLKEDKNDLRKDTNEQLLKIERLQDNVEKLKEDKLDLVQQLDQVTKKLQQAKHSASRESEAAFERKHLQIRQQSAAKSIQRSWRKHHAHVEEAETGKAVSVIQSSFRGHLARQQFVNEQKTAVNNRRYTSRSSHLSNEESEVETDFYSDDLTLLQATMRGHIARSDHVDKNKKAVESTFSHRKLLARRQHGKLLKQHNDFTCTRDRYSY